MTRTRSILLGAGCVVALVAVVGWVVTRGTRPPPPKRIVATIETDPSTAEAVEVGIATRAELAASGVTLVDHVDTISNANGVTLTLTLEPAGDLDVAARGLSEALGKAAAEFPRSTQAPLVRRESRSVRFVLHGDLPSPMLVRDSIHPTLLGVPGVTSVTACGAPTSEVDVTLDPARVLAFGLRPDAIILEIAGASLGSLRTIDDLNALSVGKDGDAFRLDSVARVARTELPSACRSFDAAGDRPMIEVGVTNPTVLEPLKAAVAGIALPGKTTLDPFDLAPTSTIVVEVALATTPTPSAALDVARRIGKAIESVADVKEAIVVHDERAPNGVDFVVRVALKPDALTAATRQAVADALRTLPELEVVTATDDPPSLWLLGQDWDELRKLASKLRAALERTADVRGTLLVGARESPQVTFAVDPLAASRYGIDEVTAKRYANLASKGEAVGTVDGAPIRLYLGSRHETPDAIRDVAVVTSAGTVPLSQVMVVKTTSGPETIVRRDRQRAVRIDVDAVKPMTGAALLAAVKDVRLPAGYVVTAP